MEAESSKVTKRRLSPETLKLIPQRRIARVAGNRQLAFELAQQGRQAIKEDLIERQAAVMAEAVEVEKSINKAQRIQNSNMCQRSKTEDTGLYAKQWRIR
uniref:Uncharacterized protein n=1 Tax=Angiostrongylus cantonensis TaxID=6313 RepID=A0A0K0DEQ4_ANGCA